MVGVLAAACFVGCHRDREAAKEPAPAVSAAPSPQPLAPVQEIAVEADGAEAKVEAEVGQGAGPLLVAPTSCDQYFASLELLARCEQFPLAAREGLAHARTAAETAIAAASEPEQRAAVEQACASAVEALQAAIPAFDCGP